MRSRGISTFVYTVIFNMFFIPAEDAKADDGEVKEDKESDIKIVKVEAGVENGGEAGEGRTYEQNDISSEGCRHADTLTHSRLHT